MSRLPTTAIVVLAFGALPIGQLQWLKGNKTLEFVPFQAPSQRFTVEYPKRDWDVSGGGNGDVTFAQKKSEALVTIQHDTLDVELTPSDITERTAEHLIDRIKGQLPKANEFRSVIRDDNGRRLVVIDYMRPAVRGGVERARQYSIIAGKDLYRIVCSSAPALFEKYDPVFKHIAETFKLAPAPTGSDNAG